MCITEIWTYHECGCRYLHPIPCYDRVLKSPHKPCSSSENWALVSHSSSSSLSSTAGKTLVAEATGFMSMSARRPHVSEPEYGVDHDYDHRLHFLRTCSIRHPVQKTFLEPICDDCLLLELGLAPEHGCPDHGQDGKERNEGFLDGAEWLLESNVEITVEPGAIDDDVFGMHSKPRILSSSSSESVNETPRRGRGRRRAMELGRESLAIAEDRSPSKTRGSLHMLKQTGQFLRRAQKQHDLKSSLHPRTSLSTSSSARPSSWIEHLKSDLGQRVRRNRLDVVSKSKSTQRTHSPNNASSSTTEDDRIMSLPSIPATASSTVSTTSASFEGSMILPLNQIISSADFDASSANDCGPPQLDLHISHASTEVAERPSTSSSGSAKSFHTATSTVLPTSSPQPGGLATREGRSVNAVISLHPLSCPLVSSMGMQMTKETIEGKRQEEEHNEDRTGTDGSKKEQADQRGEIGSQLFD